MTAGGPGVERVLMWSYRDGEGRESVLGVLEDGTVFQRLPGDGWRTVLAGGDAEASFEVVMGASGLVEAGGGVLVVAPVEFGFDARLCRFIRAGVRWGSVEPMLLIGFDMARRSGR